MEKRFLSASVLAASFSLMVGCAPVEHSKTLDTPKPIQATRAYAGAKSPISVGKFDNRSAFMRGIFSDGVDRLGGQAKTILITHLQQSGRFNLLERDNLTEAAQEAGFAKKSQNIKGADYIVTGDVSEFGRKEVGDQQLFGILGRGKSQVAYAKVSLNIVNVQTSEVVYATQGAGEYSLSEREVLGFGSNASYDSTLNGKVLDLAIRDAVNKLTSDMDNGVWNPQK
jgi:curli biogenesis system outer membrane secretion channel CsgG